MSQGTAKALVPPHSRESEMMVLGSMLTSINSLNAGADALDDSDFYFTEHKIVFQTLKTAFKQDKPMDVHLACEELKRQEKLASVGGVGFVASLAQYAGTSAYIEEYIEIVRSKSILRRMIFASQEIEKAALGDPQDVHGTLDDAQQKFFSISQAANQGAGVLLGELITGTKSESQQPYLKELQDRQELFQKRGPQEGLITGLPTSFIDLDKIINGLGNSNLIIVAGRPAMGKCVVGDTPILDPTTGALTPIKELVQRRSGKIVTLNDQWKLQSSSPTEFVADGVKPTFKITTALGRELEATAVHPLLTIKGWKQLKKFKIGDRIAVPRHLPYFGKTQWPEFKVKALAYFIADGNITEGQPGFTNGNERLAKDFKESCFSFGSVRIRKEKGHPTPSYYPALDRSIGKELQKQFAKALSSISRVQRKNVVNILKRQNLNPTSIYGWEKAQAMPTYEVAIALEEEIPELPSLVNIQRVNPVTAFLNQLGLMGKNAHEKFLPPILFELTKDNLALFINRLFSCDGTAYVANCGGRPFPVIAYASVSKRLIQQLQHLLLRFGILSKIRPKKTKLNGKSFSSYELEIHGKEDLINFCRQIGIFGKEKAVDAVLQRALDSPGGWTKDSLPIEIWDLILEKKGKKTWRELFTAKNLPPPSNLHARKRSIRRDTLARLAHVLDDQYLHDIASSDVYWDRIVKIESTGRKAVFDLTVDQTHNFVASDFIVHNTALATNIAESVCFRNNIPVGIFSLEMSAEQLLHRLICSQSEVESDKIKNGSLNGTEYQRIVAAVNHMQKCSMIIDDQPGLKITDLRARARRMKEAHDIGLLIVDYLQLLSGSGNARSSENRQNEISEISRMLKNLARELNIPIICPSQLSRKVEDRAGHRPMLSDLRESGCLTGDTLIADAKSGRRITIKELAERQHQDPISIFAVDDNFQVGEHNLIKAFYSGKKQVFELRTRSGKKIKASTNHPFLTISGWKSLDSLAPGDRIATAANISEEENLYVVAASENTSKQRILNDRNLVNLVESNILWEEISNITPLGVEPVYDATVENVHNFMANDIFVHNSIEQDSDVVLLLFRREYYDPYDKPGQAEVIVAKNRHGGIGSVNLSFRKEFAQFANYTSSPAPGAKTEEDPFASLR